MCTQCASVYCLCTTQVISWCAGMFALVGCWLRLFLRNGTTNTLRYRHSARARQQSIDFATIATRFGCIGQDIANTELAFKNSTSRYVITEC